MFETLLTVRAEQVLARVEAEYQEFRRWCFANKARFDLDHGLVTMLHNASTWSVAIKSLTHDDITLVGREMKNYRANIDKQLQV